MTTAELEQSIRDKFGDKAVETFRPLLVEYGPTIAAMAKEKIVQLLERAFAGDAVGVYAEILAAKSGADPWLVSEAEKLTAKWKATADRNAAEWNLARTIATRIVEGLVTLLIAAAGF